MNVREIDELLGIPARLAIALSLADGRPCTFTDLKQATGLADGNLHVQCRKLVDGGYVQAEKTRRGGRMVTCFSLLPLGRSKLSGYARTLNDALRSGPTSGSGETGRRGKDDSMVW